MKYLKPIDLYRQLLKSNTGRLLGVEVRGEYVFTARSDADNIAARPLRRLVWTKTGVAELQSKISEYSVSGLVFGYPFEEERGLPTDGVGVQTKRFVCDLTKTGKFEDMNYTLWDETFKTKFLEQNLWRCKYKPSLFGMADRLAYETLQGYLDFFNQNQDQPTLKGEQGYVEFVNLNQT